MIGLTPRARELLVYLSARELCPTYREMAAAIGAKSKHTIVRLVRQLEDHGCIRRGPGRWQTIEVLKPAYPPVIINGERYRFIQRTAISPLRSPAGAFPADVHKSAGEVPAPSRPVQQPPIACDGTSAAADVPCPIRAGVSVAVAGRR